MRYVFIVIASGVIFLFAFNVFSPPIHLDLSNSILADKIVVNKGKREMFLFADGKELKNYKIALGHNPIGTKTQSGDGKTPEGTYFISHKNERSKFHLSLKISYPNSDDLEQANKKNIDAGGDIMIHGLPNGLNMIGSTHRLKDWTLGCIAVTNDEIEEIWKLVPVGTKIIINP